MPPNGRYLLEPEAVDLLAACGIPYPGHALARTAIEAAQIAKNLGWPVVLKVVSPDVPPKSDVGGVLLGLDSARQVRDGFGTLAERMGSAVPGATLEGVLVCKQAPPSPEVIVGALNDVTFGHVVMFGLGGIFAEVLDDVSFRLVPLTRQDAQDMVREIRGYPLLQGARGLPPVDMEALVELLLSVSRLVSERGDIEELDLNPVRLFEHGLLVLDVRMVLQQQQPIN
jgi:acyl-CoA synthetase (NDP forming)